MVINFADGNIIVPISVRKMNAWPLPKNGKHFVKRKAPRLDIAFIRVLLGKSCAYILVVRWTKDAAAAYMELFGEEGRKAPGENPVCQ